MQIVALVEHCTLHFNDTPEYAIYVSVILVHFRIENSEYSSAKFSQQFLSTHAYRQNVLCIIAFVSMLSTYLQGFNGHKTPLQVKYLYPYIKGLLHHTVTFFRHTVCIGT